MKNLIAIACLCAATFSMANYAQAEQSFGHALRDAARFNLITPGGSADIQK